MFGPALVNEVVLGVVLVGGEVWVVLVWSGLGAALRSDLAEMGQELESVTRVGMLEGEEYERRPPFPWFQGQRQRVV